MQKIRGWQQLRQSVRDLVGMGDAARCIQPRQRRGEACLLKGGVGIGRAGADGDCGHAVIVWAEDSERLNQGFRIW
jgi:hypothetical protein